MIDLSSFSGDLTVAVIGASGGIGSAFIDHLTGHSQILSLHAISRGAAKTKNNKVINHKFDITDEKNLENIANEIKKSGPLDIIILATGILHQEDTMPEKSLQDINKKNFDKIFSVNTFGPALVMKYFLPLLNRDKKSVFAALSARVGSINDNNLGGWYAYRSSKAALNMLIKTASIEVARRNKKACIIGLHPGTVDTDLSEPFQANVPKGKLFQPDYSTEKMLTVINMITHKESGNVFAYDGEIIPA
jgi:NAD(P)-dependent dehydrogenase (short-subunit alcohol dehydrogenase family)